MELVAGLGPHDLRRLTNEMIDDMLAAIGGCTYVDVVFVPVDPEANDPYADNAADAELAWTLGHVIVHTTASAEESAALATVLARGAAIHGRSRYETPWQTVTTIAQCRQRLEESLRMRRLASLAMWPDPPHLDNCYAPSPTTGDIRTALPGLCWACATTGITSGNCGRSCARRGQRGWRPCPRSVILVASDATRITQRGSRVTGDAWFASPPIHHIHLHPTKEMNRCLCQRVKKPTPCSASGCNPRACAAMLAVESRCACLRPPLRRRRGVVGHHRPAP